MATLPQLFTALALLMVSLFGVPNVAHDHQGGRQWRGKLHAIAATIAVHPQSAQMDSMKISTQGLPMKDIDGVGTIATDAPSFTDHGSELTTTVISSAVPMFDEKEILDANELQSQASVSSENIRLLTSDSEEEEHFQTNKMQNKFTTYDPMVKTDTNIQKTKETNTEESQTSKAQKNTTGQMTPVITTVENYKDIIDMNNSLVANLGVDSEYNKNANLVLETNDGDSQREKTTMKPAIARKSSENQSQRRQQVDTNSKLSHNNLNSARSKSRPRPPAVAVNNFNPTPKPQHITSKHVPIHSKSHGNQRKLPPLGLHPRSPWKRRKKTRVSAPPIPEHTHYIQQSKNRTQMNPTSHPVSGHETQHRKNNIKVNTTSIPVNDHQHLTLQSKSNDRFVTKTTAIVDDVYSRNITDEGVLQPIVQNATLQLVSTSHHTPNMERVTKTYEVSDIGINASKILHVLGSTVGLTSNKRLAVLQKSKEKSGSAEKNTNRDDFLEKGTEPVKGDIKPRSSAARPISRHTGASSAVAAVSISLISLVTFLTIMGVYFKKISFSRKRYGQHILLSTEEDDLPLFNRQTNYENYQSPYQSWQELQ